LLRAVPPAIMQTTDLVAPLPKKTDFLWLFGVIKG